MDTAVLARSLTSILGRTVIDNTGLNGAWNFSLLTWAPEDQTDGPSLFTAIQEQLGLKLESVNAPRPSDGYSTEPIGLRKTKPLH